MLLRPHTAVFWLYIPPTNQRKRGKARVVFDSLLTYCNNYFIHTPIIPILELPNKDLVLIKQYSIKCILVHFPLIQYQIVNTAIDRISDFLSNVTSKYWGQDFLYKKWMHWKRSKGFFLIYTYLGRCRMGPMLLRTKRLNTDAWAE